MKYGFICRSNDDERKEKKGGKTRWVALTAGNAMHCRDGDEPGVNVS